MSDREKLKKTIIITAVSMGKRFLSNYEFDSDLSSDSETEILLTLCSKKRRRRHASKTMSQTVHHFTNKQFQSNFRITRETFQSLLTTIGPKIENIIGIGRPMPAEKQLLATILLLATPDFYRYADILFICTHM